MLKLFAIALLLAGPCAGQFFGNLQDITPRKYGAKCNATGDDTQGMQRSINEGGGLYIPRGFVCIASSLTIYNSSFVYVWGGGRIMRKAGASANPLFWANSGGVTTPTGANGAYVWIEDVFIDGNAAAQSNAAPCVLLQNAAYTRVNRTSIINCLGEGIVIENRNGNGLSDEINITENHIFSNTSHGIWLKRTQSTGGTVSTSAGTPTLTVLTGTIPSATLDLGAQISVAGCGWANGLAAITAVVGSTVTVNQNCSATSASVAYSFASQGPGDHVLALNHINYNGGAGILCDYCFATIIAENNVLSNNSHGAYIKGSSRVIVNNNQIRNNGGDGVYLDRGDDGSTSGFNNQVIGNQLHYNNRVCGTCGALDAWYQVRPIIQHNFHGDTNFTPRSAFGLQLFQTSDAIIVGNVLENLAGSSFINNTSTYRGAANYGIPDAQAATSTTWDPPSISTGGLATTTFTTSEPCAVGDRVAVSLSTLAGQVMLLTANVASANNVRVVLLNQSGVTQDLASGTLKISCTQ